jgi:hypothetical protein
MFATKYSGGHMCVCVCVCVCVSWQKKALFVKYPEDITTECLSI